MTRPPLSTLPSRVDLIIVGGGITGAGVLREAQRTGAAVLLLEQQDYASGTSSASSKLVHGGLRYLKTGQWGLTLESVRERQRLLREAAGLVETQPFLMPIYRGASPGKLAMRTGLWIYDRMAGASASRWIDAAQAVALEPHLRRDGLLGAMLYDDARTDDVRLVLRLILEAVADGALARNYTRVTALRRRDGRVSGVAAQDELTGETREIESAMVINATGAWAASFAGEAAGAPKLRPLRGSHFLFPLSKLPVGRAISWMHPRDRRPVFVYPWEGAVLYGTTDLDHEGGSSDRPRMSRAEADYLLEGLARQFPGLRLSGADAICSYSGVRPVVAGGKASPSAESRESALWSGPNLVGITGGKLTTFRVTARQVLHEAAKQVPRLAPGEPLPLFSPLAAAEGSQRRLHGRLGNAAAQFHSQVRAAERALIAGTPYSFAELRWAARHEQVQHLDDLLLRRTRLGLLMPQGGRALIPPLKALCQSELGWDEARWQGEERRYGELWQREHAPEAFAAGSEAGPSARGHA